jgi:hypothetical protein
MNVGRVTPDSLRLGNRPRGATIVSELERQTCELPTAPKPPKPVWRKISE